MSLCISVLIPDGIVMAGESRTTHVVGGVNRVGSDSANKIFELNQHVLAATAGAAFLKPQNSVVPKSIASLIEEFKASVPVEAGPKEVARLLWSHFNEVHQQHIAQSPSEVGTTLHFIVAGYGPDSSEGNLFPVDIPSEVAPEISSRSTNSAPGPWWIGQTDVVARIINGYDPRALQLPFVQAANQEGNAAVLLSSLSYLVNYSLMSLQDAVDFSVAMIQITTSIQRFTAGIMTQPGNISGVGGPIDIAVVKPNGKITWVARKELHP